MSSLALGRDENKRERELEQVCGVCFAEAGDVFLESQALLLGSVAPALDGPLMR